MKHEILIIFLLASTIVQADSMFPNSSGPVNDYNQFITSAVIPEKLAKIDKTVVYQTIVYQTPKRKNNWYYYPRQSYGYYYSRPVQYPLFYYLPEIKEARLRLSNTTKVPEFRDINDILNQKSEQAMRRNTLDEEIVLSMPAELHNEVKLSGSDLSEITTSSLILSARKKQLLEILIPGLLNNQRLFLQDRERLQKLFNDFKSSKRITAEDESWLRKLSEEYFIPSFQLNRARVDEGPGVGAVSQLNKDYPDYKEH